jgi:hypothetical protein
MASRKIDFSSRVGQTMASYLAARAMLSWEA